MKQLENRRRNVNEITYSYGDATVLIKREDPYGHWKISIDKGQLPELMTNNSFTSSDLAEGALVNYTISKNIKKNA